MVDVQGERNSRFDYLERIRVEMTDMVDATSFSVRKVDGSSQHQRIDDAMEAFDGDTA